MKPLHADWVDLFEERAGILGFDAALSRAVAEKQTLAATEAGTVGWIFRQFCYVVVSVKFGDQDEQDCSRRPSA